MSSSVSPGAVQLKPACMTCLLGSGLGSWPGRAAHLNFILSNKCALAMHQLPYLPVRTESLGEAVSRLSEDYANFSGRARLAVMLDTLALPF